MEIEYIIGCQGLRGVREKEMKVRYQQQKEPQLARNTAQLAAMVSSDYHAH